MNRYCYGNDYGRHAECRRCEYKRWCRSAGELPLLRNSMGEYNEELGANPSGTLQHPADWAARDTEKNTQAEKKREEKTYTHEELCFVIASMMELNYETLVMLAEKLQYPMLTMKGLARHCRISRQTVYQRIHSCCQKMPEFRDIFRIRERPHLQKE